MDKLEFTTAMNNLRNAHKKVNSYDAQTIDPQKINEVTSAI